MSSSYLPDPSVGSAPAADDEIDLRQLAAALIRRWKLIASVAASTLAISGFVTLRESAVWEGQSQIVLENSVQAGGELSQLSAVSPMLANLVGISSSSGRNSLETQLKILESPSVLRPVFNFVKTSKQRAGMDTGDFRYEDWAKANLSINLEKGTSILNISYRDTDKSLVLPVIDRISLIYKDYSIADRRKGFTNAITFLKGRINELSPKAEASMRRAEAFALAHGLGLQDGLPQSLGGGEGGRSVESSRLAAQAEVINLRQQLANAKTAGDAVLFQAPQIEANRDLYNKYQELEDQLAEKRSRLRDDDQLIRNIQRQRRALASTINQQTIALLKGQLATATARLQAASRPQDVVLKHRELVRQAVRDEKILTDLENQLQIAQLEKAKQPRPWELISTPVLLDKPVSPRPAHNLAIGLMIGIVLGSGAALVAEHRTGKVFAVNDLRSALPGDLLAELSDLASVGQETNTATVVELLASGPLAEAPAGNVALIPVGLETAEIEPLRQALEKTCNRSVLASTDLVACRSSATQLLVAAPGGATREQLAELRQQLRLQGTPVAGWLLIKPASEQHA